MRGVYLLQEIASRHMRQLAMSSLFATLNIVWVIQRVFHKCSSITMGEKQRIVLSLAFRLPWLTRTLCKKKDKMQHLGVHCDPTESGIANRRPESQNSDYTEGKIQVLVCR